VALTIAGSDSGGGAGIQADLKTFAALGVHGTCAITCITAQNPKSVSAVQPVRASVLHAQLDAVFSELRPDAVKTGMLYSSKLVEVVTRYFHDIRKPAPALVVDPVMVATSGARLLRPDAIRVVKRDLLPLATLVTPNLDEASLLLERKVGSIQEAKDAAREIFEHWGCAALIKGGHRAGDPEAVDVLFSNGRFTLLKSRFIRGAATHGTGCTLSAAIAASLAAGSGLITAVRRGKTFVTAAIESRYRAGNHEHLNHAAERT
jgi:hydroxymethylpyrimidine/phosphomethylpyrimidine kinase